MKWAEDQLYSHPFLSQQMSLHVYMDVCLSLCVCVCPFPCNSLFTHISHADQSVPVEKAKREEKSEEKKKGWSEEKKADCRFHPSDFMSLYHFLILFFFYFGDGKALVKRMYKKGNSQILNESQQREKYINVSAQAKSVMSLSLSLSLSLFACG